MKLQKQGSDECLPTAIAMVTGVDKEVVVKELKRAFIEGAEREFTYSDWVRLCHPTVLWRILSPTLKKFVPNLVEDMIVLRNLGIPFSNTQIPSGRGFITTISRYFNRNGHIVAFEDGVVYDSALDGGIMEFEAYKLKLEQQGHVINGVFNEKGEKYGV